MPECEQCGAEVMLPFECNFCGGHFCMEHRLPENHECVGAPVRTPLGQWKAKFSPTKKQPKHELMEEVEIGKEKPSKLRQLNINWRSKKLLFSLKLWFPIFWFAVGLLFLIEGSDPTQFYNSVPDSVKYIFYIFASVISVWIGYRIFEKVDSNTTSDRGLFGLRILSGVFLIIGVLMLVFGVFYGLGFFTESILNPTFSLGRITVSVFIIVLGLAFMLISAYLLFKFERRSGIIVYRR